MKHKKTKIGFSNIGGIYIAQGIQSTFHEHYAITVLISFGEAFKITTSDLKQDFYKVAIIQKNISFSVECSKENYVAFIHIVPYSEIGISLSDNNYPIRKLDLDHFRGVLNEIKDWFNTSENDKAKVEHLLKAFSLTPAAKHQSDPISIDTRIRKSFKLIMENNAEKLSVNEIAKEVHLSISHFSRLFKKETGISFRKFVLHGKLIKSIHALYEQNNLTESSFIGGFSDQSHLTRTFKKNFGIKPSASLK